MILVKNLPGHTPAEDLKELFSPFGILGRVVIPPSGISALIEFQEQQEAKAAFTKLAYKRVSVTFITVCVYCYLFYCVIALCVCYTAVYVYINNIYSFVRLHFI